MINCRCWWPIKQKDKEVNKMWVFTCKLGLEYPTCGNYVRNASSEFAGRIIGCPSCAHNFVVHLEVELSPNIDAKRVEAARLQVALARNTELLRGSADFEGFD